MRNKSRATAPILKVSLLRERHQALDDEIDEINQRRGLSTTDQVRLKEMKVRRLRLRDRIDVLERGIVPEVSNV